MPNLYVRGNELLSGDLRFRCAIGKSGFSADKNEGDGCTPLGAFPLRECWYRVDRLAAPQTGLSLRAITPRDGWCHDPGNPRYNHHIVMPLGDFNPCLQVPTRELRSRMSQAQKTLWRHLNTPRFSLYGFHRQYCMNGRYIIIVCIEKKLIIEADGETHDDSKESRDRDAYLESEGFRILRFSNQEIADDMHAVLQRIQEALAMQTHTFSVSGEGKNAEAFFEQNDNSPGHERLWRNDNLYDLVVPLGYNDAPAAPGKGSAIFLHVAGKNYEPTEGCVALALPDLTALLRECDADTVVEISGK